MTKLIKCIKLKQEAEALDYQPYPGKIGLRILENISKKAWNDWLIQQTRIINENRLNLSDANSRKFLQKSMIKYLFDES